MARRPLFACAALVAVALALGASYALGRRGPSAPPPDDPAWASDGFAHLDFSSYANRQEGDFAYGTVLPTLSKGIGHPVGGLVGLADLTGQSTYQVFIRVTDLSQCSDGCRTLSYRWSGRQWRLVADAYATDVMVRAGSFAYLTREGRARTWTWDAARSAFSERP